MRGITTQALKGRHRTPGGLLEECQNYYIQWIVEAKKEETRKRRLDKAIAMLESGKKPS